MTIETEPLFWWTTQIALIQEKLSELSASIGRYCQENDIDLRLTYSGFIENSEESK